MKNHAYRLISILSLAAWLLSGCAGLAGGQPDGTPVTGATDVSPVPTPARAVAEAENQLAQQLGVEVHEIDVVSVEPADWADTCLGLAGQGELCTAQVIPGFKITLKNGDANYTFRSDLSGKVVRAEAAAQPTRQVPVAAEKAVADLAKQLGVDPSTVQVVEFHKQDWPDGCLGVAIPGVMCTQAITPGYNVILESGGKNHVYRTNLDGSYVIQPEESTPLEDALLEWTDPADGCQKLAVTPDEAWLGDCQGHVKTNSRLEPNRQAELRILAGMWKPFTLAVDQGQAVYQGTGSTDATPAEQRSVVEWLRLVRGETTAGHSNAADGLALSWHREGGIAGFCDDQMVYLTGFAYPTSCKGGLAKSLGVVRLNSAQLERLYGWIQAYQQVHFSLEDQATADAMRQQMVVNGIGIKSPSMADKQEMLSLAAELQSADTSQVPSPN